MPTSKRTGRPPVDPDDRTVLVGVSLPARQYDAFAKQAIQENVSVPEVIRRVLRAREEKDPDA
jgi:hypothetical protein